MQVNEGPSLSTCPRLPLRLRRVLHEYRTHLLADVVTGKLHERGPRASYTPRSTKLAIRMTQKPMEL